MKFIFLISFLFVLCVPTVVHAEKNNTNATLLNPNTTSPVFTPSPSQTPSSLLNKTYAELNPPFVSFHPPWGEPTFGLYFNSILYRSGFQYLLDIRRYGWSWTPSYLRKSAPFCYDDYPRPSWAQSKYSFYTSSKCYEVDTMCNALGGTVFNKVLCIEDPVKPFTVVGPVCWNETCYNKKTVDACQQVGGQFIGGELDSTFNASRFNEFILSDDDSMAGVNASPESDAAWCAVPGKHTLIGPTCFGQECFKEELSAACSTSLNGTSFADIFCLVDDSYTVIGPICTPTPWNLTKDASVCYPEETVALCQKLGGTSIGDIFCVVKGEYSVLGPFCTLSNWRDDLTYINSQCFDASDDCISLEGNSLGKGAFCVLKGEYSHVKPGGYHTFYNEDKNTTWCDSQGGTNVGINADLYEYGLGCIFKGKYSIVGPMNWGDSVGTYFVGNDIGGNINESNIIDALSSEYVLLKGEYSVYGPSCYGYSCYTGSSDCLSARGASFGGVFCAVANNIADTIMKPNTTSEIVANNITDMIVKSNITSDVVTANSTNTIMKKNATSAAMYHDIFSKPGTLMLCVLVSLTLIWDSI